MAIVETEALILKTYNLADADKIVVFLTRKYGLLRGVAKGAKRLKSKFGGSLEPFSIVHLAYIPNEERELFLIDHIEITRSYFSKAGDADFFQKFGYLFDLIAHFTPPHEPNEKLFRMAIACLDAGEPEAADLRKVVLYFEYWLLKLAGYLPDWSRCQNCENDFEPGSTAKLQAGFFLNCSNCQNDTDERSVSSKAQELFLSLRRMSPADFVAESNDDEAEIELVSGMLKDLITIVLEREVSEQRVFPANVEGKK